MKTLAIALVLFLTACTVDVAPDGARRYATDNDFWGTVAEAAAAAAVAKTVNHDK